MQKTEATANPLMSALGAHYIFLFFQGFFLFFLFLFVLAVYPRIYLVEDKNS